MIISEWVVIIGGEQELPDEVLEFMDRRLRETAFRMDELSPSTEDMRHSPLAGHVIASGRARIRHKGRLRKTHQVGDRWNPFLFTLAVPMKVRN
ncbi:MAG: hypothetical protein JWR80_10114 [Bradyrhizobium sp.]|nr:hypothetical protein [Bradyrhizobium sp.]